jgi:hypothetical protein
MVQMPFHLRYTLNRRQRLVPHLKIWGPLYVPFIICLFFFFVVQTIVTPSKQGPWAGAFFGAMAAGLFLFLRGLFVGVLDVLFVPMRQMDVIVEANAAGILIGAERWYLFLDGITDIRKFRDDTWTIQHWNGCVLHIAAAAITDEQIDYLRAAMERGRTPEGIRAVIERGRRIEQIMHSGRQI